jgi:nicotinamidase-related amidase
MSRTPWPLLFSRRCASSRGPINAAGHYARRGGIQLRRRRVRTIVLGGVATNFGVESTARDAWERSYEIVVAEDVTSSFSAEMHNFSMQYILPRIAVISSSAAISFKED